MTDNAIALDLEGVLADVHPSFVDMINQEHEEALKDEGLFPYRYEDINDWRTWGDKMDAINVSGLDCLNRKEQLWYEQADEIPFMDDSAKQTLAQLADDYTVDIVTSLPAVEPAKQWIDKELEQGTHYRDFVFAEDQKPELDYDLFIDDNPELVDGLYQGQGAIMVPHPYNTHIQDQDEPYIHRPDELDLSTVLEASYDFFESR